MGKARTKTKNPPTTLREDKGILGKVKSVKLQIYPSRKPLSPISNGETSSLNQPSHSHMQLSTPRLQWRTKPLHLPAASVSVLRPLILAPSAAVSTVVCGRPPTKCRRFPRLETYRRPPPRQISLRRFLCR